MIYIFTQNPFRYYRNAIFGHLKPPIKKIAIIYLSSYFIKQYFNVLSQSFRSFGYFFFFFAAETLWFNVGSEYTSSRDLVGPGPQGGPGPPPPPRQVCHHQPLLRRGRARHTHHPPVPILPGPVSRVVDPNGGDPDTDPTIEKCIWINLLRKYIYFNYCKERRKKSIFKGFGIWMFGLKPYSDPQPVRHAHTYLVRQK